MHCPAQNDIFGLKGALQLILAIEVLRTSCTLIYSSLRRSSYEEAKKEEGRW